MIFFASEGKITLLTDKDAWDLYLAISFQRHYIVANHDFK